MRFARTVLAFAVGASLPQAPVAAQRGVPQVTLYMPALASDGPLGLRAATVLNLQIWQTLRRAPFPNPANLSFGDGLVLWDTAPLADPSHAAAEAQARAVGADMALWGRAWRYGDGVAVQVYLTVVDNPPKAVQRWAASFRRPSDTVSLSVGLPRLRYEFAPIVLESAVVQSLSSPLGLPVYADEGSKQVIGHVGGEFVGRQQNGAWIKIESGKVQGWLHLPQLSRRRSEIPDFVGGVIRLLRTDWAGAADLFARVVRNPTAANAVKVDANLMLALAQAHLGGDRMAPVQRAYALNPHEVVTTKYECMEYVARLAASSDSATARYLRTRLGEILDERRYLYASDDPWFQKVRRLVRP